MAKDERAQHAIEINAQMEKARGGLDSEVDELNRLVVPDLDLQASRIGGNHQNHAPPEYRDDLQDSTAAEVHETLQNGLMAHLTPVGTMWMSLGAEDGTQVGAEAKHWLHYAGQNLLKLLAPSASNFYVALARSYSMDGGFGTSVIIPRLSAKRKLVFDSLPMLTYCLANDGDGVASTLGRTYDLSSTNVVQMFGKDAPEKIAKKASNPTTKLERSRVLHVIEPNHDRDPRKMDRLNQPFRSIFVDLEEERTIRQEGYFEQPHAVGIWKESLTGPYGISPFSRVLPDIRQLQLLAENRSILVERAGNPPWFIPGGYDGKFDPNPFGINIPGGKGTPEDTIPREMPTSGRLDHLQAEADIHIDNVKKAGFYDLFRMLTTALNQAQPPTAYHLREAMGEKATLFHPFYARKSQQITQIIQRSLALALRSGMIAPPPAELLVNLPGGQVGLKDPAVLYNSKLARAMELTESNALLATAEALLPFAGEEGINSPFFDWLDASKVGPSLARAYGVDVDVMSSAAEIEAKQQARIEAKQQASMMEQGKALGEGIRNVGGIDKAREAIEV